MVIFGVFSVFFFFYSIVIHKTVNNFALELYNTVLRTTIDNFDPIFISCRNFRALALVLYLQVLLEFVLELMVLFQNL